MDYHVWLISISKTERRGINRLNVCGIRQYLLKTRIHAGSIWLSPGVVISANYGPVIFAYKSPRETVKDALRYTAPQSLFQL